MRFIKSRVIPLLPLWTFVVCSRVNFTFTFPHYTRGTVGLRADVAVLVQVDVFTSSV